MARPQRLVISDLHEVGLVDALDAINLKENALTSCRNLKPRNGRLASASKLGALVSNTPVFSGANYRTARLWRTYGSSAKQLMLLGSEYFEYCDEDGNRSAIPYWMGIFGKTETNGILAGNKMGALYTAGDVFASNVGSKLTTSDRVFLSELTAGDSIVDANFTKADGALPAGWTVDYGSMAVASNAATSTTLSWATNSALSVSAQDNWLATIRYCTMTESSNNAAAAIYVRDSATKRGYIIDVSYEYAESAFGGPDEYMMRFYAGYINDASNIFANSLLIQNDVVETSATADWTNYRDMWMWYRKPFITWGYGNRVMGVMPVEFTFGTLECGIVTFYSAIGPKQGSTHNPVMFWKLTDRGPYTPSAVSYVSNNTTLTGVTTEKYGLAWGAKACDEDTHHIRAANEYAMRLASDIPLLIWKGGMMPEYCPIVGQPTADGFGTYVYWTGNDTATFNGHLCLTGAKILVLLLNPNLGYYEFFPVLAYPTRMMYAVANDPDDWSTNSEGAGYIEMMDTPGEATAIWPLRDTLMIYKGDATVQLTPTGLAANPFRLSYFDMSLGADTAKCVVDAGKYHFFARDEGLYIVSTGDLSIVPTSGTLYNYRNAHRWNHDNTVVFGQYNVTDDAFVGRAYNYKTGTMYELFLADVVALDSANNYACALTHAGAVYGYSGQDIENATSFNPYSTAEYFETPQLNMGTMQYNKTINAVDVIVRSFYASYAPIVKLIYTVNGTAAAELTVTSESIGNGIYRARFTFKANGVYFKFKVTSGDAANRIGYVEYVRLEVDYFTDEPDQRTTAT